MGRRKEKGGREGGRRSIFQKRNLICPEVCHGTRINSRALESRRERLLRATARASIGCHSTFPLFPRRRAIIERRRLWCTRLAPGKLLSLSLSYPLSNEASFQGVYKKKKKIFAEDGKVFREKIGGSDKKKRRGSETLRFPSWVNTRSNGIGTGKYCPSDFSKRRCRTGIKRRARDEAPPLP